MSNSILVEEGREYTNYLEIKVLAGSAKEAARLAVKVMKDRLEELRIVVGNEEDEEVEIFEVQDLEGN